MKQQARDNLTRDSLRRWWCKKYQLPPTSDEYLRYTLEQMFIEYWEDYYEQHPHEVLESGNVRFVTEDPTINAWEEQLAKGEEPDLSAATTEEDKAWLASLKTGSGLVDAAHVEEEINDVYDTRGPQVGASFTQREPDGR
jgi:hypothetical protein